MLAVVVFTVYLIGDFLELNEKGGYKRNKKSEFSKILFLRINSANYFLKHF